MSDAARSRSRRPSGARKFACMSDTTCTTPTPADLLAEQERSGLTIAAFARDQGIAPWKLYAALHRIRAEREAARNRFASVTVVDSRPLAAGFELDLPAGRRLHIPRGFDEDELMRLVAVLAGC